MTPALNRRDLKQDARCVQSLLVNRRDLKQDVRCVQSLLVNRRDLKQDARCVQSLLVNRRDLKQDVLCVQSLLVNRRDLKQDARCVQSLLLLTVRHTLAFRPDPPAVIQSGVRLYVGIPNDVHQPSNSSPESLLPRTSDSTATLYVALKSTN